MKKNPTLITFSLLMNFVLGSLTYADTGEKFDFMGLPEDIMNVIFEFLSLPDSGRASSTSRHFSELTATKLYRIKRDCSIRMRKQPDMWIWDESNWACYPSFIQYCLNPGRFSPAIEKSVGIIVAAMKADSCESAREQILSQSALYLNHTELESLEALREFTHLKAINLAATNVTSIKPIRNWTQLEGLNLNRSRIRDLKFVSELKKLKWLNISHTHVKSLQLLAELKMLKSINASYSHVRELMDTKNLSQLEFLDLSGTFVADIQQIKNLPHLSEFVIEGTPITALPLLDTLPALNRVWIYDTKISSVEITMAKVKHARVSFVDDEEYPMR